MNEWAFLHPAPVYIEISQQWLKALRENDGLEIPLEREASGRLTAACKLQIARGFAGFLHRKRWQLRVRALCAIGANGVALRRLSLPAAAEEGFQKLLALQIEREFPLPPDELAWGYRRLAANGGPGPREVLVVALKKEALEDYAGALVPAGLDPTFYVAALARHCMCPEPNGPHAMLDFGGLRPEWAAFEHGQAVALRVLPPGEPALLADWLAKSLGPGASGGHLHLTAASEPVARELAARLGNGTACSVLAVEPGLGRTAAILGLKKAQEGRGAEPLLMLQTKTRVQTTAGSLSAPEVRVWLKRASVLLVLLLILPYAEAMLLKPFLARRLAVLKADKARLLTIDHELDFLQFLKQSQPPYLDALFLFAKSAPPGARLESLTMNRRGEVSLRGVMQNGQLVSDFRSKLIASGFYSNVVVEEQSPTPDRQKVNVRLTAQWKPAAARAGLALGPTAEEIERARTNKEVQVGGAFPPGMMPPMGMPGLPGGSPMPRPARR